MMAFGTVMSALREQRIGRRRRCCGTHSHSGTADPAAADHPKRHNIRITGGLCPEGARRAAIERGKV